MKSKFKDSVQKGVKGIGKNLSSGLSKAKRTVKRKLSKTPQISTGSIRVNQNLTAKYRNKKDLHTRRRAEYLSTLPKSRFKRFFYRLHPRNLARYWFSRDGLIMALKISGFSILFTAIFIAGIFAYFRKDLPKNITDLDACSLGQTIKFYDRTKTILLWSGAGDVDCRPVPLSEVSPYLQKAVVAAEDKNFYKHLGFDPIGIFNAAISNVIKRGEGRGGSTITQQYVKLALLTSERSFTRKIKELILSVELDASYKKEEILQAYLNEIGFAYQYNGAEAAARGIFDKSAKDLTLDESATLAAGIPSPDLYWVQDQESLIKRRNYVLDQMVSTGDITKEEATAAKKIDTMAKVVKGKSQYKDIKAPHFVLEVYDQLKEIYGKDVTKLGLSVTTSLNYDLQKIAEESVTNGFPCRNGFGIDCVGAFNNAALVAEDVPTGQVVALVGSRSFDTPVYGELNLATTPRSPGSTYKPYDYAALMASSKNWGPGSILYDLRTNFGGNYRPQDVDNHEPGGITMRYALGNSRNIPAIRAMYIAGIEFTHEQTKKLGVYSGVTGCQGAPNCEGILSTAIGDGGQVRLDEHVHGYASFSRLGKVKPQTYILKIENKQGKVLQEWKDEEGEQGIDPEIAYLINDMLADRNASYFRIDTGYRNNVLNNFETLEIPVAIKTGTTNFVDNGWMLGHTTKYATGVWIGNHENLPAGRIGLEQASGPIWGEFMRRAHELLPEKPGAWTRPAGIKTASSMDAATYSVIKSRCRPARFGGVCNFGQSDLFPSWYTPIGTGVAKKGVIDTISGKLATECTPELAKKEITGGGGIQPEIPTSDPNYRNWLAPIVAFYSGASGGSIPIEKDDRHSCSDAKPSVSLNVTKNGTGYYTFTANVTQGTATLQSVNIKIDGQTITGGAFSISSSGSVSMDYFSEISGSHAVSAQAIDTLLYESTTAPTTQNFDTVPTITVTKSGPNLTWTDIDWVDSYQYTIKDSTGAVVDNGSTPNNSRSILLLPNGTYSVVIDAIRSGNVVRSSGATTFTKP